MCTKLRQYRPAHCLGHNTKWRRTTSMNMKSPHRLMPIVTLALVLLTSACGSGPAYLKPTLAVPSAFKEGWQPAQPADEHPKGTWWQLFNDPELDALAAQINVDHPTLRAAEAQYRQANALARSAQAALRPQLGLTESSLRGHTTPTSAATTRHTLNASLTWEADLWQSLQHQFESGSAEAQASAADLAAAKLSLQTELAQTWFQLRALDAQRQLLQETAAALEQTLTLVHHRHAGGLASAGDVALAENQWQSTRALALDVGLQRARTEHALATLLGKLPTELNLAPRPLTLAAPPDIPPQQPASLLERRPDIAAAERRMAAANARIGVAQAAFFPTLTFSTTSGWQNDGLAGLIAAPHRIWSLGPSLALSLFDGGARTARTEQAQANYDATVAAYRQSVLTAFKEVEDALVGLRVLQQEADVQQAALNAARKSLSIAQNQYRAGTVAYLNVLSAQNAALSAERNANDIAARRQAATIQLIKAIGGGWSDTGHPPAPRETRS